MNKIPCIRGLKQFNKGCPQKEWDPMTGEGCPAYKVIQRSVRNEPLKKIIVGQCIDLWQHDFTFDKLGFMESNQQAIESFRNGMLYKEKNGDINPKPNPVDIALFNMISNRNRNINQIEEIKDA